jgi:CRISPR-associated endonuclease/helicase Cas3
MPVGPHAIALWAKLGDNIYPDKFHPLLFHLADVALVARLVWDAVLREPFKKRFAAAVGLEVGACGSWVAFWVGAHDIGKACPPFQGQGHDARTERLRAFLKDRGLSCGTIGRDAHHAAVTVPVLEQWLVDRHLRRKAAERIAVAVGGHHGLFQQGPENPAALGGGAWGKARTELLDELALRLGVPDQAPEGGEGDDQSFLMALAGLTSVADWVGSNAEFFPPAGTGRNFADASGERIRNYLVAAEQNADRALSALGWSGRAGSITRRSFGDLFHDVLGGRPPRRLQEAVEQTARGLDGPTLVLVEAPMGEGKTEAAWYVAHCWDARGGQGAYVALPTMATSNQMFGRVVQFLEFLGQEPGKKNLMLLHGKAALNDQFETLRYAARVYDEDRGASAVVAEGWFAANKKHGLLAPYGVGTIDQALLAVLQTKHVFVRLFGLAGKCVILDEVHAYDAYMTTLMERLLRWLAALGCPVVLLSATLPRDKRLKLLRAYAGEDVPEPADVPYPRVTTVAAGGAEAKGQPVEADPSRSRTVQLEWLSEGGLACSLREALADGGCAAVIRNTVGLAQATFLRLRDALREDGIRVELFHARFPFGRRKQIEDEVLRWYGRTKDDVSDRGRIVTAPHRPCKSVLVATQVVEQSLDLDFDVMASDVAPVDLVLQRAGRLWRHDRTRPARMTGPRLWLVEPEVTGRLPDFGASEYVYARFVLLRSYLVLKAAKHEVRLPDDLERLIEQVYVTGPTTVPDDWRTALDDAKRRLDAEQRAQRMKAKGVMIHGPADEDLLCQQNAQLDEDNPDAAEQIRAATRDTEPTVQLIVVYNVNGRDHLDPAGHEPYAESDEIDVTQTRLLLNNEVTVGHRGCVAFYANRSVPAGWKKSGILRHHRVVRVDGTGASLGQDEFPLRFDPDIGLCFTRDTTGGAV